MSSEGSRLQLFKVWDRIVHFLKSGMESDAVRFREFQVAGAPFGPRSLVFFPRVSASRRLETPSGNSSEGFVGGLAGAKGVHFDVIRDGFYGFWLPVTPGHLRPAAGFRS